MAKNRPHDVFRKIDMCGGDTTRCWPWTGSLNSQGRPYFMVEGKRVLAYRLVYELFHGHLLHSHKDVIRHKCDNPECCNPYHLEIGSHEDNMKDMKDRERHGLPQATRHAILRLRDKGMKRNEIMDVLEITEAQVRNVLEGKVEITNYE